MNEIKCIEVSNTNCFLLKCKEGYLLIDTGYPNKYKQFIKKLKKLEIDISEIKYILLTHHHYDHAGLACILLKDTRAKLIVHQKAIPLLKKGITEKGKEFNLTIKLIFWVLSLFNDFTYPPVIIREEDYIIKDDDFDLLKEIGIDGVILYTPGHSKDSISVLLSDGKAFVGDAAMDFITTPYPIIIDDINEVYNSWDKLIEYGAKTIYPAHGNPFDAGILISSRRGGIKNDF